MEVYFIKYNELIKQDKPDSILVQDIFKQCFHEYFEGLHRYAFTILKDNEEAKDVVQSAFYKFWIKREEINMLQSARSYLYTSVYNLSLNAIRNKKVKQRYQFSEVYKQALSDHSDKTEEKEIAHKINEAIGKLPEKCKEVFVKSRFEEKKYIEIAEELKISVKTVEAHMGHALKTLRTLLKGLIS